MKKTNNDLMMNRGVRIAYYIFMTICVLFWIWAIASWLNIGFNNNSPEQIQNQWSWNLFKLLLNHV